MSVAKVFNKSIKGASHNLSGKPCQDFSGAYQDEDVQIVVVCDGHGGNTYFRSDVGARIACKTTIEILSNFAKCISSSSFLGTSFAITAQPKKNPFIDPDGNKVRFEDLSDDQKELAKQARSFIEAECKYQAQQAIVKDLIARIYELWLERIKQNVRQYPFTPKEKSVLGNLGIEKAYGCTLLAFLRTKDYWLAFHIGDGKIYCCDSALKWNTPVPDDCACFLNYTTSLCDSNPLIEFRFAFNGKDDSPVAIMLCSDGLDGSLRTKENVQDFYEQIIGLCLDGDDVNSELERYLPFLSESGNKDDISLAGIVDLSSIDESEIRHIMELKKRTRSIQSDYRSKKAEIEAIDTRIESRKLKYGRAKDNRLAKQTELDKMRQEIKSREKEVNDLDKSVNDIGKEIDDLRAELKRKKDEFENWKFTVKNEMAELEIAQGQVPAEGSEDSNTDYTDW